MISIIDYGLGNIRAFVNVYDRLNIEVQVIKSKAEVKAATKLILPGVGSFDYAMESLNKSGMRDAIDKAVLEEHVPVLGICVGMQMLANGSDEGKLPGLGWIDGDVKIFDEFKITYKSKLPHMGWNTIETISSHPLMHGLPEQARFYFLHSYYFKCNDPDNSIAYTSYGEEFSSAVAKGNIHGVQFHPEKSHANGIQLLANFAKL